MTPGLQTWDFQWSSMWIPLCPWTIWWAFPRHLKLLWHMLSDFYFVLFFCFVSFSRPFRAHPMMVFTCQSIYLGPFGPSLSPVLAPQMACPGQLLPLRPDLSSHLGLRGLLQPLLLSVLRGLCLFLLYWYLPGCFQQAQIGQCQYWCCLVPFSLAAYFVFFRGPLWHRRWFGVCSQ